MNKPLLVLFDGNALVHRAFHALPPLTISKTGEMINAAYGFVLMLLKVLNELHPDCYAIAFDRKAPTFRHKLFSGYKAQRPTTPEELVSQIQRVRQISEAFNMPVYEMDGYEADDILGTLCKQANEQGLDTIIVTGDADTMQLVSPSVKILYPKPRKPFSDTMLYDEAAVMEKYGVKPSQIADMKALQGDSSDNIPGIPGIGSKTAVSLLQKYGSLEGIYEHLDEITPPRLREQLKASEAMARLNKELATIKCDAPVKLDTEQCRRSNFDRSRVTNLFRELEFHSLLQKLPEETEKPVEEKQESKAPTVCNIVNNESLLHELIKELELAPAISFDTETTGEDPHKSGLVGISFATKPGKASYIPVGHSAFGTTEQLPLQTVIEAIKPVMENPERPKLAQNAKFDMTVLANYGINVNNIAFDTMIAAYLLNEKNLGLKALAFSRLGIEMTAITELIGTGTKQLSMSQVDINRVAEYCAADADMVLRLTDILREDLIKQNLWELFARVEMPLVPVLFKMEQNGILLDTDLLRRLSHQLGEDLIKLETQIYNAVGHRFNINSPQQLSTVLFEELNLPKSRKTTGGYSTDAAILEELRPAHPVIGLILDYRQLSKLKSTYIDALPGLINPKTGRVHTSFNQTRTTTGRLSSSDPNLQNIPVRTPLGKQIRQAFIAPEGSLLLSADYSQIDLRALAHLSQDQTLIEAFRRDEDIHTATASQLFNVEPSKVTPDMRRLAKTVNFGIIYGMSEYGLEQATELSREEAARFIAAYFEKRPRVKAYLEETKQTARTQGYVQTLLGRRRYIPEINSSNRNIRESAERMAINMPVQGTSADIIKVAMVRIDEELQHQKLHARMLLQVHDELIFEVPESEIDITRDLVVNIMSNAVSLSVPLKVDIKQGKTWGDME